MTKEDEELYDLASAEVAKTIARSYLRPSRAKDKDVRRIIRDEVAGAYAAEFRKDYESFLQLNQRRRRNVIHQQVAEFNNKLR